MSFLAILLGEELHSVWMLRVRVPTTSIRPRAAGTSVSVVPATGAPAKHERDQLVSRWSALGELQKCMAIVGWVLVSSQGPVCARCTVLVTGVELQPQKLVCPGASCWWDLVCPGTATGQTECLSSVTAGIHTGILFLLYTYISICNLTLYNKYYNYF